MAGVRTGGEGGKAVSLSPRDLRVKDEPLTTPLFPEGEF